jgi:hypothetical protein
MASLARSKRSSQEEDVVDVEQWAELRRLHFIAAVSIRELQRRTRLDRKTIQRALRAEQPPSYRRRPMPSKLDPFKQEIHRLLGEEPRLPGVRVRELIAELGYAGGQTIVDDYLRELRPLFLPRRAYQRTRYRPGELCQFSSLSPGRIIFLLSPVFVRREAGSGPGAAVSSPAGWILCPARRRITRSSPRVTRA